MKIRLIPILLFLAGLVSIWYGVFQTKPQVLAEKLEPGEYQVAKVVDGDTISIKDGSQVKTVRLVGMNTPETVDPRKGVECFGPEASKETKALLTGKTVFLTKDTSETDKYGRLLRFVYLKVGDKFLFVNDYLLREGFAKVLEIPPDLRLRAQFAQAQAEAQHSKKGLWSKCPQ